MPNSERIESLISPEALKQFEQLKASSDANVASLEKLIAKAVELNKALGGASTFRDTAKAAQDLTDNEKALAKQSEDLAKSNAKLQALYADEAKKIAQLKVQQQEQNKVLKEQAKEALGLVGSYDKLTKEYNDAAKAAKDLAAQFGAGSKQAQVASKRALELDARLKAADANVGRFNKNVGNYSSALNTLQKALQDVSKKIDDNTKSGQQNVQVMEALKKEQGLLQSLVDVQSKGFANATGEIRKNQQAIQLLSQVYGEDSEVVRSLIGTTASLTDEVGDLRAQIKAQASDTQVFDGLINAAQGLTAVYQIGQGAAALFGDENEELQKTFVKLQAVMAVLQGLQAIQNVLQKESAARQLINIGLQKAATIQTSLQSAAESKNIIVKYASIVAQKALNLAMSAAGGPLLAVIGIITLLVLSLKSFAAQADVAKKSLDQLSAEFDRDLKALQDYSDFVKRNGDEIVAEMESQFASEKDIRSQRTQNLKDQLTAALDLEKEYGFQVEQQQAKLIRVLKKNADDRTDKEKEDLEKQDQLIQKFRDQQKKRQDIATQVRIQQSQNLRAGTEESIKAQQEEIEATKTQLQTRLQMQQSITADERKTQKERVDALKESARIQRQLINDGADSQRLTPGLTPSQIKVIEAQRAAALTQARRESNKAIEDLNRAYAEREKKARFDIVKTEIEDQIKASDLIAQTETNSFDKRTDALYAAFEKRRALVIAQHEFDIQNDTLTAIERTAIEKKYLSDINQLTVEYGMHQRDLYQQNQDAINAIIEKNQQGRLDKISADLAAQNTELTKQLVNGQITLNDYNKKREAAERDSQIKSLREEINNATAKVLATKEGTAERFAAEKELREKTDALNQLYYKKEVDGIIKLNETRKQLASEAVETFSALVNGQFDAESARVQQAIDDLDKQKEKEIEVANATIANKQERENAIARIEARAQVQREQLEKRQKQIALDRARFEKASNIAQIISTTALAVIKAFKDYAGPQAFPIAAAIGAIGALQLARAIATPLPAFEHGTDDAPGGLALVGEKRRELVITPQGNMFQTPSVPTVMNVPKHSIVLPDARAALESGLAVSASGRLVETGNGSYKIEQKLDNIAKVIKNKPVLNMSADKGGLTALWKYGSSWIKYEEDQTRF